MVEKTPVSVLIITKDEEDNIGQCLESVKWADEIFVIDSGSGDKTLDIARTYTEKVYHHPFENFAQQRNWAQKNLPIKNGWVMHLDADERVSPGLEQKLREIFASPTDADGFMMPRKTIFKGRWIRYGGHYPVYHLRLFKKDKGMSEQRMYDQNYIVEGKVLRIEEDIVNVINTDLESWKARHRRWSCLEAQEVLANKERIMKAGLTGSPIERRNWLRYNIYYKMPLFVRPLIYFFYRYIIRLGFLDGAEGLVFHFWQGLWYRVMVDLRIWQQIKRRGETV